MQPSLENPFRLIDEEVSRMRAETHVIFVDIHAETTSEKIALGRFLDGKVSAVAGTHTHVQTADEQIFPGGTAFICDAGMCGPTESVLGREIQPIIQRFMSSMPVNFPVAKGEVKLHGILVDIDPSTGKAKSIRRVAEPYVPEPVAAPEGHRAFRGRSQQGRRIGGLASVRSRRLDGVCRPRRWRGIAIKNG